MQRGHQKLENPTPAASGCAPTAAGEAAAACPQCRALVAAAGGEHAVVALAAAALAGMRLLHDGAVPPERLAGPAPPPVRYAFRREGDYWTLACQGRVSRVRGLRGFDYVAELLRHPHRQLYVVDLAGLGLVVEGGVTAAEALANGLRLDAAGTADAALDRRARADYRARWRELVAEEAAARRDNDLGRLALIRREIEMLTGELAAAAGRTPRSLPSLQERARVNVRNCISAALRSVRRHDEGLWRHLANAIHTGIFCSYEPERPVDWEL